MNDYFEKILQAKVYEVAKKKISVESDCSKKKSRPLCWRPPWREGRMEANVCVPRWKKVPHIASSGVRLAAQVRGRPR